MSADKCPPCPRISPDNGRGQGGSIPLSVVRRLSEEKKENAANAWPTFSPS
jgi:hypothetical protein